MPTLIVEKTLFQCYRFNRDKFSCATVSTYFPDYQTPHDALHYESVILSWQALVKGCVEVVVAA